MMSVLFIAAAVVIYVLLSITVQNGLYKTTWFIVTVTALVAFCTLAYFLEHFGEESEWARVREILNWHTQSWAYLSDSATLAVALGVAAHGWKDVRNSFFIDSNWYLLIAPAIGIAGSVTYHFLLNKPGTIENGHAAMLDSPTFLWHAVVVYPVLFSALIAYCVPLFSVDGWRFVANWHPWVALAFIAIWAALGIRDGSHGLDPWHLHRPWDKVKF
ncbi:MAG: hypothetical protein WAW80_04600, partial [Candidatus Saccharimonadales bacterium]